MVDSPFMNVSIKTRTFLGVRYESIGVLSILTVFNRWIVYRRVGCLRSFRILRADFNSRVTKESPNVQS